MSVVVHTVLDLPVLTPGCRTLNGLVYTAHVQGSHSSLTGSIILPPVLFDPPTVVHLRPGPGLAYMGAARSLLG